MLFRISKGKKTIRREVSRSRCSPQSISVKAAAPNSTFMTLKSPNPVTSLTVTKHWICVCRTKKKIKRSFNRQQHEKAGMLLLLQSLLVCKQCKIIQSLVTKDITLQSGIKLKMYNLHHVEQVSDSFRLSLGTNPRSVPRASLETAHSSLLKCINMYRFYAIIIFSWTTFSTPLKSL